MPSESIAFLKGSNQPENGACIAGEGLGIGLRLAKAFVDLHGGSLEAFSEGSRERKYFCSATPIFTKQAIIATDHLIDECVGTQETKILLPQFQVLVVDDDRSMRFLVFSVIAKAPPKGDHCRQRIASHGDHPSIAPEVVILDLQMHGLDGLKSRVAYGVELNCNTSHSLHCREDQMLQVVSWRQIQVSIIT